MKHLRRFNESSAGLTKEEIKDFCEINLAYLLDDGMDILMDEYNNAYGHFYVTLSFRSIGGTKWVAIKDQVIPFLVRLRDFLWSNGEQLVCLNNYGNKTDYYQLQFDMISKEHDGPYEALFGFDEVVDDKVNNLITRDKVKYINFYIK
jgi:hypothetical protein